MQRGRSSGLVVYSCSSIRVASIGPQDASRASFFCVALFRTTDRAHKRVNTALRTKETNAEKRTPDFTRVHRDQNTRARCCCCCCVLLRTEPIRSHVLLLLQAVRLLRQRVQVGHGAMAPVDPPIGFVDQSVLARAERMLQPARPSRRPPIALLQPTERVACGGALARCI